MAGIRHAAAGQIAAASCGRRPRQRRQARHRHGPLHRRHARAGRHAAPRGRLRAIAAGRVTALDLDAVQAAPGVVAVLTADDIPGKNDVSPKDIGDDPLIAEGEVDVLRAGAVRGGRRDARPGPRAPPSSPWSNTTAAGDAGDRRRRRAGRRHKVLPDYAFDRGEPPRRIARRPSASGRRFRIGGQEHFYLEGQVALAVPGEDGDMMVYSSTQHPDRGAARRRPCAGPARQRRHRRGAPHGRRLRRQGDPGHAMGGPRGARRAGRPGGPASSASTATTT